MRDACLHFRARTKTRNAHPLLVVGVDCFQHFIDASLSQLLEHPLNVQLNRWHWYLSSLHFRAWFLSHIFRIVDFPGALVLLHRLFFWPAGTLGPHATETHVIDSC